MPELFKGLNILGECRDARLEIWACPPFLFVVMGAVNITAILLSWLLANRYVAEPEVVALIVLGIAVAIFVIGNFIIHGFRQIAEANRIKTEFIAIVSHQLRSPLSIFKWTLDVMSRNKNGTPSKSAADTSYLVMLTENTEKMIQLVNMLLEVSRIDAGRLILRHDEIELGVITQEIIRAVSPFAQASRVNIEYAAPERLPAVRGDREKIKMVIQN
ncbi:MAG: histidine kinase dimerization/phospho-acceptor domain-containing protein, partial [Patescibacteria group bacterium]